MYRYAVLELFDVDLGLIIVTDGGGVKGLTSLLVLKRIFESIQNQRKLPEVPKPCEYFDMIGGTSTGGYVISLLLVLDSCEHAVQRISYL